MKRRNTFAALAIGLTLVAAACGSDDKKTSNSTATSAAATPTTAASTETTGASTETSAGGTETTEASTESTEAPTESTEAPTESTEAGATGGTVRIGVEQEWDCMDWMGSCGGSTYGSWSALFFTSTRPYDFEKKDDGGWGYVASNLVSEDPTVEMVDGKQTVTYKINPDAV